MKHSARWLDCAHSRRALVLLAAAGVLPWLVGCGRGIGLQNSNDPHEVLKRVADRYKSLTTFSEKTSIRHTVTGPEGQESLTAETSLFFQQPNKLYWSQTGENAMVIVSDGQKVTVYRKADNGYVTTDMPATLAEFLRGRPSGVPGLHELALLAGEPVEEVLTDMKVEAGDTLKGQAMKVLRGAIKKVEGEESAEPVTAAQRLWLGENDALTHKSEVRITRGQATLTIEETMTEVEADPALSPDRFTYSPPKGARNLGRAQ